MSWNNVIGQERVKILLRTLWESNRLPHAFLFHGPEGVGKDAVAMELAGTLNCERRQWDACGTCPSCQRMASLQHPNLTVIFPLPRGKDEEANDDPYEKLDDEQIDAVRAELANKARNPYHRIQIPRGSEIKINSIRAIRREAAWLAADQGRPVVLISDAHRMNLPASNALLKTLEEPTGNLLLILTTHLRDILPATIISRCQQVHFEPLRPAMIAGALRERFDLPASETEVAAHICDGSFTRALELVESGTLEDRESVVEFLRAVMRQDPHELMDHVERISGKNDRPAAIQFLSLLCSWFRDVAALQGGAGDRIINTDLQVQLQKFSDHYTSVRSEEAVREIERSIDFIDGNANIPLVFLSLSIRLCALIKADTDF